MRRERFILILARGAPFLESLSFLLLVAAVVIWFYVAPISSPHGRFTLRWSLFAVLAVVFLTATVARVAGVWHRPESATAANGSRMRLLRILFHLTVDILGIWLLYLIVQALPVESL